MLLKHWIPYLFTAPIQSASLSLAILPGIRRHSRSTFSTSTMSWTMDSWSRPRTNSKTPAPLYISSPDLPYCHTCGRVMSSKKPSKKQKEVKYCSDRCRSRKPGAKDRAIERKIAALLDGEEGSGIDTTAAKTRFAKGDHRMIVTCDEIEAVVFGNRPDSDKANGRRRNRRSRAMDDGKEWRSIDMETTSESEEAEGGQQAQQEPQYLSSSFDPEADTIPLHFSRIKPARPEIEINTDATATTAITRIEDNKAGMNIESPRDPNRRREGARRAEEREMVRRAARRAIVFGIEITSPKHSKESSSSPLTLKSDTKDKSRESKRAASDWNEEIESLPPDNTERRKAEALINGVIVEPSFAKGNWSLRWRE